MRSEGFYTDSQRHLDLRQRKIHLSVKYSAPQNVWIREYKHILSGLFLLVHLTKQKCVYYLSEVRQSLILSIPLDSIKRNVWSLALLHCKGYIVPFFENTYLLSTTFGFVLRGLLRIIYESLDSTQITKMWRRNNSPDKIATTSLMPSSSKETNPNGFLTVFPYSLIYNIKRYKLPM